MMNNIQIYIFRLSILLWASLGVFFSVSGLITPIQNPTWLDISNIATSNTPILNTTKLRSNTETANRYCRELNGFMDSYTEFNLPNKINLVEYKPSPINWKYKLRDKYINYIVCDIIQTNTNTNTGTGTGTGFTNINVTVQNSKIPFNSDHLIQILLGVGTNTNTWKVTVIYIINFINLYMLYLCIKWGFRAGFLFTKNKL